jgi:hypothetical protein
MTSLYVILAYVYLMLPIFIIFNNIVFNKGLLAPFKQVQKYLNNICYFALSVISLILLLNINNKFPFSIFFSMENSNVTFIFNEFNLLFGFTFSTLFFFLNWQFQKMFRIMNLSANYSMYNQQLSYIFYITLLIIFSNNMLFDIFFLILLILCTLLFLHNPDLKDIKNKYLYLFSISIVEYILLYICVAFISYYNSGNINFSQLSGLSNYWVIFVFACFIGFNYIVPSYSILKEQIFYEDLLPLFIIFFIPFVMINTFLFMKTMIYVFDENIDKLHFYYIGFFMVFLFLVSLYPLLKQFKNNRKFVIMFNMSTYIVFSSQLLFIIKEKEILQFFVNFIYFIFMITVNILTCCSVVFLMLKTNVANTSSIYKVHKNEIRFHLFTIFAIVMMLPFTFYTTNFHNFNILYLVNLLEMLILLIIFFVYIYFCLYKKPSKEKELLNVDKDAIVDMFIVPIVSFIVFLMFLFFKNQVTFILFK